MKKIFVTGVTGFIGSHLVQELVKKGHEVYAFQKYSTSRNVKALEPFLKGAKIINGDLVDYHSTAATLEEINPDVVMHLAALSPVRDSFEKPFLYVQNNVVATLNIGHAMLKLPDFKKKKLIYASTAEVYGIQEKQPTPEDVALNPSSPYATAKAMTDNHLRMMASVYGLNVTIMRNTNTFGRKIDAAFFVEYLITTMLKGEAVYVGAPDSIREYMYVTDHVDSYIKAMEHSEISGEAFNVAPGTKGISNKDLTLKVADMIGFDKKKIIFGKYPPGYPMRPIESDQPFIVLDITKVKKKLGWSPKVSLEEGLTKSITYWKEKSK
ncbi:MAG: NAD(P)-dependent oxidoreductase [Candidatus Micrarchaeota archaeon]